LENVDTSMVSHWPFENVIKILSQKRNGQLMITLRKTVVIVVLLFVPTLLLASLQTPLPFKYLPRPYVIGHRGSRYLTPESTIIGFETGMFLLVKLPILVSTCIRSTCIGI
jgi:hypothetical protein